MRVLVVVIEPPLGTVVGEHWHVDSLQMLSLLLVTDTHSAHGPAAAATAAQVLAVYAVEMTQSHEGSLLFSLVTQTQPKSHHAHAASQHQMSLLPVILATLWQDFGGNSSGLRQKTHSCSLRLGCCPSCLVLQARTEEIHQHSDFAGVSMALVLHLVENLHLLERGPRGPRHH